jgi:hypothetical protein
MKADALAHEINLGQASMRLALLDLSRHKEFQSAGQGFTRVVGY